MVAMIYNYVCTDLVIQNSSWSSFVTFSSSVVIIGIIVWNAIDSLVSSGKYNAICSIFYENTF